MGQSPLRRSWEEIVMKSSEHWSVVAASARHWQELARRKKANESGPTAPKKRGSVHSITEDMVSLYHFSRALTNTAASLRSGPRWGVRVRECHAN